MEDASRKIDLEPIRPETYDTRRDCLAVSIWLNKAELYFHLVQLDNPNRFLTDNAKIIFESTFSVSTVAVCRFTMIQENGPPETWEEFNILLKREFVPQDHLRRSRNRLRKLRQNGSVSKYLSEF